MKNTRVSIIIITLLCLSFAVSTMAQDAGNSNATLSSKASARGLSLSIGAEGAIPVGTFNDAYKLGVGGSAKLGIPVMANGDVTISAGYILFSRKNDEGTGIGELSGSSYSMIPFKGGFRYRTDGGFYVEPQAGYTQVKVKNTEGKGAFTYALNLGYLINDMIDLSARYEAVSSEKTTLNGATVSGNSAKFIGIRLAYNINFAKTK